MPETGTSGGYGLSSCHPYFRRSSWPTRNLALCGNFNLTNTDELFDMLVNLGQHPTGEADTAMALALMDRLSTVRSSARLRHE